MNQYIKINYNPSWNPNPNYWDIWFELNKKEHREKSPNFLDSDGYWDWYIHNNYQKEGNDFDWSKD